MLPSLDTPLCSVPTVRRAPFWPGLETMAHTLVYDATIMGDAALSPEQAAVVRVPTLAICGSAGPPVMREVAQTLARTLPNARAHTLEGATHDIAPALLGPVLEQFLSEKDAQR